MFDQPSTLTLVARRFYDGDGGEPQTDICVKIRGDRISTVSPAENTQFENAESLVVDTLCPGFIDLQINGAMDVQFNDTPTADGIATIARGARQGGTAYLLPTFITAPGRDYLAGQMPPKKRPTVRTNLN